jgi:hypothetical protein
VFTELYIHTDRNFRRLDLEESMAERPRRLLVVTGKPFPRTRIVRMLFQLAGTTGSSHAEGSA